MLCLKKNTIRKIKKYLNVDKAITLDVILICSVEDLEQNIIVYKQTVECIAKFCLLYLSQTILLNIIQSAELFLFKYVTTDPRLNRTPNVLSKSRFRMNAHSRKEVKGRKWTLDQFIAFYNSMSTQSASKYIIGLSKYVNV